MKIYLFQTVKDGKTNRLRPLPFQKTEEGNEIFSDWNTQADMAMRNDYPVGTFFASETLKERIPNGSSRPFYSVEEIFPVSIERNKLLNPQHAPSEEMVKAFNAYMSANREKLRDRNIEGTGIFAEPVNQNSRTLTKLEKIQMNPRFAKPTMKDDGFWVDDELWWDVVTNIMLRENTLLKGPTGTGKTELVQIACQKLGLELHIYDMGSMFDPQSNLQGVHRMTEKGSVFDFAQFTQDIQKECVILFDEISRATPAALNTLLPVLDNRRCLRVEIAGAADTRIIPVNPKCIFFATANIGAEYVGTSEIDPALKTRFEFKQLDYIPATEEISMLVRNYKISDTDANNIVNVANSIRNLAAKGDLDLPITPRETIRAAKKVQIGYTCQKAMERCFLDRYEGTNAEGQRSIVRNIIFQR